MGIGPLIVLLLGAAPLRRAVDAYLEYVRWEGRIEGGLFVALVWLALFLRRREE